ncbi:MFS transporter [Pontibacter sp. G13]|uniref:MFS transporter n=1 Tax=Pontibacter sp. G13 TaxID=3074898 RepID=UPI00288A5B5E|nr:MFS transporter [Pontibacter sp. G13]WNJ21402.1 MFS transporter [Pontibacter sp. G13]
MGKHTKTLILLFAANTISGFAQGITMLAIPWYLVNQPGGKALNATMVATVTFLALFWGIYAGTLVDRYSRKRIFQALTLTDAVILLGAAYLGYTWQQVPFPLIALVFCATIFTYNVHYPNLYAFVQELFEPALYGRVNSAIEIQGQFTSFVGMMIGGILLDGSVGIAWWPEAWAFDPWRLDEIFLLDGSTYVLGFCLISAIPYQRDSRKAVDAGPIWNRVKYGFSYLWERKELMAFGIASYVVFFSLLVIIQVVGPVYVNDYLHADAWVLSSFKGLYAIGAIIAGLMGMYRLFGGNRTVRQIMGLVILAGLVYSTYALTKSVTVMLGGAILLGIANAGTRILRITYLVKVVPNEVIGRVNSFFTVVNVLMRVSFLSLMALPFFADDGNGDHITYALAILAGVMVIAWVALLRINQKSVVAQSRP